MEYLKALIVCALFVNIIYADELSHEVDTEISILQNVTNGFLNSIISTNSYLSGEPKCGFLINILRSLSSGGDIKEQTSLTNLLYMFPAHWMCIFLGIALIVALSIHGFLFYKNHCRKLSKKQMYKQRKKVIKSAFICLTIFVCMTIIIVIIFVSVNTVVVNKMIGADRKGWMFQIAKSIEKLEHALFPILNELLDFLKVFVDIILDSNDQLAHLGYNIVHTVDEEIGFSANLTRVDTVFEEAMPHEELCSIYRNLLNLNASMTYLEELSKDIVKGANSILVSYEEACLIGKKLCDTSQLYIEMTAPMKKYLRSSKINFYKMDYRLTTLYEPLLENAKRGASYSEYATDGYDMGYKYINLAHNQTKEIISTLSNSSILQTIGKVEQLMFFTFVAVMVVVSIVFFVGFFLSLYSSMSIKIEDIEKDTVNVKTNRRNEINLKVIKSAIFCDLFVSCFMIIIVLFLFIIFAFMHTEICECMCDLPYNPEKDDLFSLYTDALELSTQGLPFSFDGILNGMYRNETLYKLANITDVIPFSNFKSEYVGITSFVVQVLSLGYWFNIKGIDFHLVDVINLIEDTNSLLKIELTTVKDIQQNFDAFKKDETEQVIELISSSNTFKKVSNDLEIFSVYFDQLKTLSHERVDEIPLLRKTMTHLAKDIQYLNESYAIKDDPNIMANYNLSRRIKISIDDVFDDYIESSVNILDKLRYGIDRPMSYEFRGTRPLYDAINDFLKFTICGDIVENVDGLWFSLGGSILSFVICLFCAHLLMREFPICQCIDTQINKEIAADKKQDTVREDKGLLAEVAYVTKPDG